MKASLSSPIRWNRSLSKMVTFARRRGIRRLFQRLGEEASDVTSRWLCGKSRYERWFEAQQASSEEGSVIATDSTPLISILMPVCDPDPRWLQSAIDSVRAQRYSKWQLCIVDDASKKKEVELLLRKSLASDPRLVFEQHDTRKGISQASNRALSLAKGEYIALLDHDDELTPDALSYVAGSARKEPFDIFYSDEDKLDRQGRLRDPAFKPDRCRDLLQTSMYFGHLTAYRADFMRSLGGFDSAFDGSQDYELALRAEARAERVVHMPRVLYHWRMAEGSAADPNQDAKPWAYAAGRRAIEAAVRREDDRTQVVDGVGRGHVRIIHPVRASVCMSVLYCECCGLPNRSEQEEVAATGAVVQVEWIPMSAPVAHLNEPGLDVKGAASIGARWNEAAAKAKGDLLVFFDGVRPRKTEERSWILELAAQLQRTSVGLVGTRISDSRGRLLHAGAVLGGPSLVRVRLPGLLRDEAGHLGLAQSLREVSAVTGGSLAIRRSTWQVLNGFDPAFNHVLHDVDFCLRIRSSGQRVLYDPNVDCEQSPTHKIQSEAMSDPNPNALEADLGRFKERWESELCAQDPFSNPSFHDEGAILHPAFRSRL